tara:strand:+ start:180 stop:986 length:807 start_codon:yes stop_codon:yes gene_type:complete
MKYYGKSEQVLEHLLEAFKSGNVADAVAHTVIQGAGGDRPIDNWSFSNQLFAAIAGTQDARGFNQWKKVGRHVKKGAKAIYILVPRVSKKETEDEDEIVESFLYGFGTAPVFRVEDTDGDALPEADELEPVESPPLIEVAEAWGINVTYVPFAGAEYGSINVDRTKIRLATHDESTFFHELAHAADGDIQGELRGGQHPDQEIVAELSAAVLGRLLGVETDGRSYRYIEAYASRQGKDPHSACLGVLYRVREVLQRILKTDELLAIAA